MTASLSDVLAGQRWEKALFTTYALSLTFFESIVLRALREVECREIWVIADAEGYRSSLMERGSHGVGYEYHLVPIGLRNGVFHPKCCYFVGADSDVLAIGSGNLTFGGFGRNLEVIEVLSSETHSGCLYAFAEFLNALKLRTDVVCPDLSWVDAFADRAFQISGRANRSVEYPRLISSVEDSAKNQLRAGGFLVRRCSALDCPLAILRSGWTRSIGTGKGNESSSRAGSTASRG